MSNDLFVKGSQPGTYKIHEEVNEEEIFAIAKSLANRRLRKKRPLSSSSIVKNCLQIKYMKAQKEIFGMMLLDTRHRCINISELFYGTIDGASVYPREVIKEALKYNAAAVIFFHNHPSGVAEPSASDEMLTKKLIKAMETVEIRVLDHIVVACGGAVSFSERGLL